MLTKLAFKNVFKSFKDYTIYFFTLVLGVSVFYLFNSIESQTALIEVTKSGRDIIKLMTNTLSGLSVFIAFILGFLIIYANKFLMKRRHKEFAIYLTLGMSKRKVSTILLIETMIVGVFSLIVGLILGVGLSQFMSVFVSNMFEADMEKYEFIFSIQTCIKTLVYFGIMYLVMMLFNTFTVGKYKLIDLLQSGRKSEKIKLKNPILCVFVFIIACVILGMAYYQVTFKATEMTSGKAIFIPILMGIVSTFLIFWSLSGLILKIVMSMKSVYYKGLNSFTLRQVSSKINTTVISMTVICLMLFVTICTLSSALSLRNEMVSSLDRLAPVDIVVYKEKNIPEDNTACPTEQIEDSRVSIEESFNKVNFDINKYFKDIVNVNVYTSSDFTMRDSLEQNIEEVKKEYPFLIVDGVESIMKISDYNKVAKLYGNETLSLNEDEYAVVADYENLVNIRNTGLEKGQQITLNGKTYKPKYNECKKGFLMISSIEVNAGIVVFPDKTIDELNTVNSQTEYLIANYNAEDKDGKKEIEEEILNLDKRENSDKIFIDAISRIALSESSIGLSALVTFIGLYLGIVFLITSAGLLALKELTESTDSKGRYDILKKIGADKKMISKSLFTQIFIFFMFPLFIAIIHSIVGLKFSNFVLSTFGGKNLLISIIMTTVFLVIIYGGYFLITYFSSKSIINKK